VSLIPYQVQLEALLAGFQQLGNFMQLRWSWPFVESAHFIGLTLLLGPIAAWDLRLLGLLKDVPLAAFHRLVPFAVIGFVINMSTGFLFLVTYPDQYVYNTAFHVKMLCVLLAGLNVLVFYAAMGRRMSALGPGAQLPAMGRLAGAVSLTLWITVIVCGRMITFFRPPPCPAGVAAFIADCIVR
jgi:hypothetical protein